MGEIGLTIRQILNLDSVIITEGGPSPSDPEGLVARYLGIRDKSGNGFHIGVNEKGTIVKCGATLNGKAYRIPVEETLNG